MSGFLAFINRFILSLAGFPLVAWLWFRHSGGDPGFTAVVMGIPLLFGYLVPGLAIVWLRMWEIRGRFSIKGIQVHQGFIYASGLALDAYVSHHLAFDNAIASVLGSCLVNGCIVAFTGWFIDIAGVKAGRIRIHNPMARLGKDPETVVTYYAPACYFTLGATYMLAVHLAWEAFLGQGRSDWVWARGAGGGAGVFVVGFLITAAPITAVYLYLQHRPQAR
jgi:hypothetical protein